jgi:tripartite-type tricarboxylate transporter receptor subunit TctC
MKPISMARRALLLAASAACLPLPAFAQLKITRLVVGFAPGGPLDAVARLISEQLGKELGQTVVVENRAGANGAIAAEYAVNAPPDGSVLWITSAGAVAVNPALYKNLAYDPVKDLSPVSLVNSTVEVLVVGPHHPAGNVEEFLAYARKKDGATLGSSGTGSVPHLAMELLTDVTRAPLVHVPYKGVAPAISDSIAGHIDGLFADVPVVLEHIRSGQLKAIGIASPKRHPLLPDVKTFQEQGVNGVDSDNWYAIFVGKSTPQQDAERISQAVRRALENPGLKARLLATGVEPAPTTPAQLAELLAQDTAKWSKVVVDKKITVNN